MLTNYRVFILACAASLMACACQRPTDVLQSRSNCATAQEASAAAACSEVLLTGCFRENFIVLRAHDRDVEPIENLLLSRKDVVLIDRVPDAPLLRVLGRHPSLSIAEVLHFVRDRGLSVEPASESAFNDAYTAANNVLLRRSSTPAIAQGSS